MVADEDRHRRRLVPRLVLVQNRARVARHDERAGLPRPLDLQPVKRDVAHAGVGVARDHQARGDVGRLLAAGAVRGELREVDLIALQNHFLHRPGAHQLGRVAEARALGRRRDQLLHRRAVGERRVAEVRRRHAEALPLGKAGHVLEQQGLFPRLVQEGAHLGVRMDGFGDVDELARPLQLRDPRAHVFRHIIFSLISYTLRRLERLNLVCYIPYFFQPARQQTGPEGQPARPGASLRADAMGLAYARPDGTLETSRPGASALRDTPGRAVAPAVFLWPETGNFTGGPHSLHRFHRLISLRG